MNNGKPLSGPGPDDKGPTGAAGVPGRSVGIFKRFTNWLRGEIKWATREGWTLIESGELPYGVLGSFPLCSKFEWQIWKNMETGEERYIEV